MTKRRKLFEKWIVGQFGKSGKVLIVGFSDKDGYEDEIMNSMWLGFNAGVEVCLELERENQ